MNSTKTFCFHVLACLSKLYYTVPILFFYIHEIVVYGYLALLFDIFLVHVGNLYC